jgi:hypothetical protein
MKKHLEQIVADGKIILNGALTKTFEWIELAKRRVHWRTVKNMIKYF